MPLARIITRSNPCSRQLALDLLGRGYAVEIVSPDSVPDNLADLELRVEEDPGNQLVASVEAHNGDRSASLEFVHFLKTPMPDFVRRPPEPDETIHLPKTPVNFNARQSAEKFESHNGDGSASLEFVHLKAPMPDFIRRPPDPDETIRLPRQPVSSNAEQKAENVKLPTDAPQLAPEIVSPATETLREPALDPVEVARPILPSDPSPSLPVEPPGYFAVVAPTLTRPTVLPTRVGLKWEPRHDRSAGWLWRTALALASVVLLALVLALGMRSQSSGATPTEKIAAASTDASLLSVPVVARVPEKDPGRVSTVAVVPPAVKSDQRSDHMPKESQVAIAGASTAAAATGGRGAMFPRRHGDGLIARDTVTYFHQRSFDQAASRARASEGSAGRHQSSRKYEGIIAANTVTLNEKPAPKAVKQDSGVKRYSDLK